MHYLTNMLLYNLYGLIVIILCFYYFYKNGYSIALTFLLCYLLYFIFCLITVKYDEYKYAYTCKNSKIPTHVYTYWHDTNYPYIVKKCIASWRKHCPNYTIHIINKDNLKDYAPIDFSMPFMPTNQLKSDMIRLYVLAERGGIWLDASVYINASLDWIHGYQRKTKCEFLGYDQHKWTKHYCIESWFLACIPTSPFMNDWKNEFFKIQQFDSIPKYIDTLVQDGINLTHLCNKEYLVVYAAAQRLVQCKNNYKIQVIDHNPLMTGIFPLFYHMINYTMIKYTAGDRYFLEKTELQNIIK